MERETSLEERERKDKEKADAIRERQMRLGHIPREQPEVEEEPSEPKPRAKRGAAKK